MPAPADTTDAIIRVRDFTAAYDGRVVLDDLSFDVARGEVFVILGGSGSGKSTLLKHMIGLYTPASGSLIIDGDELTGADETAYRHILTKIGVMYQSGALFGSMTLLQNITLPMEEFTSLPPRAMRYIARIKLAQVGLEGAENRLPAELSGGMIKRAAIARAMALDPKIVFLDEPSAGLDPITSAEIDRLILQLRDNLGITFVVVTHELASIFAIADRVILLDAATKKIAAQGPPKELAARDDIPLARRFFHRELD